ncbi:MAG TPA: phasin family protein, partial [Anaerolineae bacterium]|nr:phasin family protein [Anaerolineae bacterium]
MGRVEIQVDREPGKTEAEIEAEMGRMPFMAMTRRMLLASIGAVALAQDEMESFVNRLVERGELAEQEGKELLRDVMEKRRRQTRRAEVEVESRVEDTLQRMNVPTRSDIEALSAKITA